MAIVRSPHFTGTRSVYWPRRNYVSIRLYLLYYLLLPCITARHNDGIAAAQFFILFLYIIILILFLHYSYIIFIFILLYTSISKIARYCLFRILISLHLHIYKIKDYFSNYITYIVCDLKNFFVYTYWAINIKYYYTITILWRRIFIRGSLCALL